MPELHIAGERARSITLKDEQIMVLGRDPSCDIPLPDPSRRISRQHAVIVRRAGSGESYFVRDLGSVGGVRVCGDLVYQRTLEDGDVIEIGKYRLRYSHRESSPEDRISRIRIVPNQSSPSEGVTGSTVVPGIGAVGHLKVSDARREVIEHILHCGARTSSLNELLDESLPLIVRSVDAVRGFAGVFTGQDQASFREVGITGFSGDEAIEINDATFSHRLRSGELIERDTLILAPITSSRDVLGFFCVERPRFRIAFTAEDAEYLMMLGRLAAQRLPATQPTASDTPQEWGLDIVASRKRLNLFLAEVRAAAEGEENVLLLGKTGTGKELFTRAIRKESRNATGPYIARDCNAIPTELVPTELFGYAPNSGINNADPKGAPGCFESAHQGVLFLDELQGLSLEVQDKLLRVLQEKEVWRIGARRPVSVNVKVIAATDGDITHALRQQLLYRFGRVVSVPPLSERREDIPLIAFAFIDRYACRLGTKARSISRRALELLAKYSWPGNVRELDNVLRSAVKEGTEVVVSWNLPDRIQNMAADADSSDSGSEADKHIDAHSRPAFQTLREMERAKLLEALEATRGNITAAGRLMGYKSRMTTLNKMKAFGIPRDYGDALAGNDTQVPGSIEGGHT